MLNSEKQKPFKIQNSKQKNTRSNSPKPQKNPLTKKRVFYYEKKELKTSFESQQN